MDMKKNRLALLAVTAVAALGMTLAGCGEKEAEPTKTETTTSTDKAATETKKETAPAAAGNEQVVKVNGKNWAWDLDKTEVKKGQPVKLIITSTEGMHNLSIDGTTVDNVHAMSGKEEVVTFTPDKAGELFLRCTLPCGTGHGSMVAKLKVTD